MHSTDRQSQHRDNVTAGHTLFLLLLRLNSASSNMRRLVYGLDVCQ